MNFERNPEGTLTPAATHKHKRHLQEYSVVVDQDGGLVLQAASVHEGVPLSGALLLTRLTDVPQPLAQLLHKSREEIAPNDIF